MKHFGSSALNKTLYFRRPNVTPTVFLSEVGGIFGLCLGCSLLSGLEVFYWLFVKVFCAVTRNSKVVNGR